MNKNILILLECEGIILQLEKKGEKLYFNFKHDKYKLLITEEDIRKFLNGELTIESPLGKIFDIKNYIPSIQYKQEDLDQFLKKSNHLMTEIMTLRDEIAIQFMNAVLTTERFKDYIDDENIMVSISKDAYLMADTMIDVKNMSTKKDSINKVLNNK